MESFANVRTSGPSGPTNPRPKGGRKSGEVNCRSFRVLPLHSRAFIFSSFSFFPPPFPSELRPDPAFISLHRALLLLLITRGKKISTIFEMRTTFFQKLSKIDLRKKERKEIGIRNCPRLTEKDERRESKDRKIAKRKREREKKEKHRRHRVGHSLSALIDIISSHLTKKT